MLAASQPHFLALAGIQAQTGRKFFDCGSQRKGPLGEAASGPPLLFIYEKKNIYIYIFLFVVLYATENAGF
jgi:hypothetical protein